MEQKDAAVLVSREKDQAQVKDMDERSSCWEPKSCQEEFRMYDRKGDKIPCIFSC